MCALLLQVNLLVVPGQGQTLSNRQTQKRCTLIHTTIRLKGLTLGSVQPHCSLHTAAVLLQELGLSQSCCQALLKARLHKILRNLLERELYSSTCPQLSYCVLTRNPTYITSTASCPLDPYQKHYICQTFEPLPSQSMAVGTRPRANRAESASSKGYARSRVQ